jgi:hypothetical protein
MHVPRTGRLMIGAACLLLAGCVDLSRPYLSDPNRGVVT